MTPRCWSDLVRHKQISVHPMTFIGIKATNLLIRCTSTQMAAISFCFHFQIPSTHLRSLRASGNHFQSDFEAIPFVGNYTPIASSDFTCYMLAFAPRVVVVQWHEVECAGNETSPQRNTQSKKEMNSNNCHFGNNIICMSFRFCLRLKSTTQTQT